MIPDVKSTAVSGGLGVRVLVHVLFSTWSPVVSFIFVLLSAYTYCHGHVLSALLGLVSFGQTTCPNTPPGWTHSVFSALGPLICMNYVKHYLRSHIPRPLLGDKFVQCLLKDSGRVASKEWGMSRFCAIVGHKVVSTSESCSSRRGRECAEPHTKEE
jgi:hypothetical protein